MRADINARFFQELGRSPKLEAALLDTAGAVEASAVASAPVVSGGYKSRFRSELRRGSGRSVARVVNDDPGALAIEARHGTLQRAGRSVTK